MTALRVLAPILAFLLLAVSARVSEAQQQPPTQPPSKACETKWSANPLNWPVDPILSALTCNPEGLAVLLGLALWAAQNQPSSTTPLNREPPRPAPPGPNDPDYRPRGLGQRSN